MLVLAIVALEVPLALNLARRVDAEVRSQARSQAEVVAASAAGLVSPPRPAALAELVGTSAVSVRGRVIVVDAHGIVIADSAGHDTLGDDYASRPEIVAALSGRDFQDTRRSQTLREDLLATAAPIVASRRTVGAVRITQSVARVQDAVERTIVGLALVGLVVLVLGLGAGLVIAEQVARPLRRLEATARAVDAGDLQLRAREQGSAEQRSLARSFNDMTERLVRALRAQQDFVADASHQLRTPLAGLRLRLEEARAEGVSGGAERELDAGMRELDRLSVTIDELLVLSRAGERDAPGERLSLDEAATRAAERWAPAARDAAIAIAAGPEAEPHRYVWCARADLDRALDALVENAIRYGPAGSEVRIVAGAGRIEVLDEGPGLAQDEAEAVFERFHRGSAGRAGASGTGLGLAIARELARSWGGEATLANRDGRGAVAVLRLPAFAEASPRPG